MPGAVDLKDFLAGFVAEADEHLRNANTQILAIERALATRQGHPHGVRELFRSLHTIKGLAAMVGVDPIVEVAHALEAVLRNADREGGVLAVEAIEPTLEGLTAIQRRVRALAEGKPVERAPAGLVERLVALERAASVPPPKGGFVLPPELDGKLSPAERAQITQGLVRGARLVEATFVPTPAAAAEGHTITSVRERLRALGEIVRVFPVSVPRTESAPGGLEFRLLVTTDAPDAAVAAAAATSEERVHGVPLVPSGTVPLVPSGTVPLVPSGTVPLVPSGTVPLVPSGTVPLVPKGMGLAPSDVEVRSPLDESGVEESLRRDSLRVGVDRLDEALERLAPLSVSRFKLARALAAVESAGGDVRELRFLLEENTRYLRDLRAAILRLRMVPLRDVLEPIPLLVRGLQRSTGKRARVEVEGARAELDKAVAERLLPALVHLVRNAVDHGIETPAERAALSKPEEGLVRITCVERSNDRLEITVRDDGAGIDAEAVARQAGRPVPQSFAGLLELLATPGLSTRDEATTTSGRGFGMDIVKRVVVGELGGEWELETTPGQGTAFVLRIPLSVAVVSMFRLSCGEQEFLVPIGAVEEILEVSPSKVVPVPRPPGANGPTVRLLERRGQAVPFVVLGEHFGLAGLDSVQRAILLRGRGRLFGFAVDRVVGQCEVVVRPLVDPLVKVAGVSGTADLGEGRPTLVLDLPSLAAALEAHAEEAA